MSLVLIFLIVVLIMGLVYIYTQSDKSEDLLFLKLLGYYLLGCFRFNFNKVAIPLGFLIYLLFLHPKMNARSKSMAAVLGLVFFIGGVAQPAFENYLYELPIKVKAESTNLYDFDYLNDWESLSQKLQLPDDVKLEDFYAEFEADGQVKELRYKLIGQKDGSLVYYDVNLKEQNGEYMIRRTKVDQWLQYNRLVTAQRLMEVLSKLDINKLKPEGEYAWYCITSQGELIPYAIKDREKFILADSGDILTVDNEDLPITGYYISLYGMYGVNEVSYEGRGYQDYFFDIIKN